MLQPSHLDQRGAVGAEHVVQLLDLVPVPAELLQRRDDTDQVVPAQPPPELRLAAGSGRVVILLAPYLSRE